MADLRKFRQMVLIICQGKAHDKRGRIRYIVFLDGKGGVLWADDPTWPAYRKMSGECPWILASVIFASCKDCNKKLLN